MTEGTKTFEGLAVPLYDESEIQQQTVATDILTITGGASQTGDFLVLQTSAGAELFVVSAAGNVDIAINSTTSTNHGIKFTMGASSVTQCVIDYTAGITAATTAYLGVASSNGPTYLLSVAGSAGHGVGAAATNGFYNASLKYVSAPSTAIPMGGVKMIAGSKAYWIPCIPDTGMA